MDLQMPVMDGFEATREIRKLEEGRSRVPILAVSANASELDRENGRSAGLDGHVAKPVTPEQLFSAINDAFEAAELIAAGRAYAVV